MSKVTNFKSSKTKEDKLEQIAKQLEGLKGELAKVIEEYEAAGADEYTDTLTEALDALNDAADAMDDVLMDLEIE